jgi:hypothetical protein
MKKAIAILLLLLTLSTVSWSQIQQSCSINSYSIDGWFQMLGMQDHAATPGHSANTIFKGSCVYNGGSQPLAPCYATCVDDGRTALVTNENWATVPSGPLGPYRHHIAATAATGSASANGANVSCASTIAVATARCLAYLSCTATVSISASASGIGASVSFGPSSIWNDSHGDAITCLAKHNPPLPTPIIIDIGGDGYHLSLLKDGVPFNFYGDGMRLTSWPEMGALNAFLVLPDENGMVPTAKQMFGNQAGFPNGFLQLAQYDGNGDGQINAQDQIWSILRVWVDANHDGISQPGELHTLDEYHFDSFLLKYKRTPYVDENGNAFGLKGTLIVDTPTGKEQRETIYDVTLQTQTQTLQTQN